MIIPLYRKITLRTFPYCTLCLVLINVAVFLLFQRNDDLYHEMAIEYYVESGLLDMEFSFYKSYKGNIEEKNISPEEKFFLMKRDKDFEWKLTRGEIIPHTAEEYPTWKKNRDRYENLLQKTVSARFGLSTDNPRWPQFFTHMFLHGGWDHLLGNMIFLWLAGCLLEQGCGALILALVYLGGGLCAAGLFLGTLPGQTISTLVGASGSIAGIMGAITTLYGMQRIKIFLMLGFYFNYLRVPAMLLLPLWIGYELFNNLQYGETNNVAYMAHVGGLLGGAAMGFVLRRFLAVKVDAADPEEQPADPAETLFADALLAMRELRFERAEEILQDVIRQDPHHLRAHQQLFAIAKARTDVPAMARYGQNLLERLAAAGSDSEALAVYQELVRRNAWPEQPERLASLASFLSRQEQWGELEKAVALIIRRAPGTPQIPALLLQLAHGLRRSGNDERGVLCLRLLAARYPHSQEAILAQSALRSG